MVRIHCRWCNEYTEAYVGKNKHGERNQVRCYKCLNLLPSSSIESTENVNRKHIHSEWK